MSSVKELLRQSILEKREGLGDQVGELSALVQESFLALEGYKRASKVAFYSSIRSEVSTDGVIKQSLKDGKEVYLPRVKKDSYGVDFVRFTGSEDLKAGAFGVLEPTGDDIIAPEELDLIVLPGVAFDESGARIGYGKGHYDMTLEKVSCTKVAFAFEIQVVEKIETEPHDVGMDIVITEERIIRKNKQNNN